MGCPTPAKWPICEVRAFCGQFLTGLGLSKSPRDQGQHTSVASRHFLPFSSFYTTCGQAMPISAVLREFVCCAMQQSRMEPLTTWILWSEVSKAIFRRRVSLYTIESLPLGSSLRPSETVSSDDSCHYSRHPCFLGLLSSDTEAPGPNEATLLNGNRLMIDFMSKDKNV